MGEIESPFDPLGQLYIGGGRQFSPGPLVGIIFTIRSLGRRMRPIKLMGWAIPPTLILDFSEIFHPVCHVAVSLMIISGFLIIDAL